MDAAKVIVCGVAVATVGGSVARHTQQWGAPTVVLLAVDVIVVPPIVVVTVVPLGAKPQTTAEAGARCSTMESWRVALSLNFIAGGLGVGVGGVGGPGGPGPGVGPGDGGNGEVHEAAGPLAHVYVSQFLQ